MIDNGDWDASDEGLLASSAATPAQAGLILPASRRGNGVPVAPSLPRHNLQELAAEKRRQQQDGARPAFRSSRAKAKKRPRSPRRSDDKSEPSARQGTLAQPPRLAQQDQPPAKFGRTADKNASPYAGNYRGDRAPGMTQRPANSGQLPRARFPRRPPAHNAASYRPPATPAMDEAALRAYEAEQDRAEREWYLGDDDASAAVPDATLYMTEEQASAGAAKHAARMPAHAAAKLSDTARWEQAQLDAGLYSDRSGVFSGSRAARDDDDIAPRVALIVKQTSPAFMSGQFELVSGGGATSRAVVGSDVVMPVKDPTSDMAIVARKGSALVSEYREKRGRSGSRVKYWELGQSVGAKAKEDAEVDNERTEATVARIRKEQGSEDWRKDMKYAGKMSQPSKAVGSGNARASLTIQQVRRSLPVYTVREELLNVIRENQVVVVEGETGSGKTTQLTQYLVEEGFGDFGIVGCTQPRRVAAVSVAQRVAEEFGGGGVGAEVGYAIRFEDCTSPETRIKYMTDGILLRESLRDPDLERYSVIIMDEAHERSLNTDVLFGALKGVISRRRDLKVIITSATLNADRFSNFFGHAPVFRIPGRTFPVDTFFSKTPVEDYVDGAVWQVMQIHLQAPLPGDILVFMTGQEDIETSCEALAEKLGKLESPSPLIVLPIYSQLAADLQAKIFEPAPEGTRKVVVATNIAETSLTIDGIRFVVDAGYCKLKTYNPRLGMDALLLCPASQAAVDQRAGRAGRTGPGKCYRLFTGPAFASEMLVTNVPEIQRTNLSHVVLLLKSLGVQEVLDFPFLDPPPAENVLKSMLGLWYLGALDSNGKLTKLGTRMSKFPLDPALSALLFSGEEFGCLDEAVTIVAMLSVPNVFMRPSGREEESDAAREKFFIAESDHLSMLHTYKRWLAAGCRADWSAKHFINNRGMRKAREVRQQLEEILRSDDVEMSSVEDWDIVRRAVATAYYYQVARRKGMSDYINVRSGVVCGLHPTSSIYGAGMTPDYICYHELIHTKREFMSVCTAVEPQWVAEARLGPLLYTMKVAGYS